MGSLVIAVDTCFNPLGKDLLDRHGGDGQCGVCQDSVSKQADNAEVTESFTPTSPVSLTVSHLGCAQDLKSCLVLLILWSVRLDTGKTRRAASTHWSGERSLCPILCELRLFNRKPG